MQETQETWVQSLDQKDALEKGMATHSSILVHRKSNGQRSLVGYSSWSHKDSDTTEQLNNSNDNADINFVQKMGSLGTELCP